MNKRQQSAKETKRKLITAGLELMKEQGFDAINVEDITRKARVAKGTFYTYFKRKEDIVLDISRVPFSEIREEMEKMKELEIIEKLSYYFHRFMECVESCGINVCRQWTRDVLDPNKVPDNKDGQKWSYDFGMLKEILNNAIEKGELKKETPVELLTHILISQLYGMMTCWCMSDGKFEPLEWTKKFCNAQLNLIFSPYIKEERIKLWNTEN